jgi:fumarylacetoacetase
MSLNETHDAGLRSWVASANTGASDFPIQNLPYAVFRRAGSQEAWRGGVAIGDQVLDLARASALKALGDAVQPQLEAASQQRLNGFMAMGPAAWSALRLALSRALREGAQAQAALQDCLVPQAEVEYTVPAQVGDYTDFYTSVHHATNVGKLFRPDNPLMENYKWVPIGYHGRASSLRVSGVDFRRPMGQLKAPDAAPALKPCARLDYELEMGIYTGAGNAWGEAISMEQAENHIFGLCLLNDWSARDIQAWEYQPLGPFQGKKFASTVSPWIVTSEALAPFRRAAMARGDADPELLPYLRNAEDAATGGLEIALQAWLSTPLMRERAQAPRQLSASDARHLYWTPAQMVAQHTLGGCNLRPGDLLGSGTISTPDESGHGSLLELTHGGTQPITLPSGETRLFLEAGDEITLTAHCSREGFQRIGFGASRARITD